MIDHEELSVWPIPFWESSIHFSVQRTGHAGSLVLAVGKGFTSSGSSVKYLWHHDLTHVFRIALRHETWVAYNTVGPVAVLIVFFSVLVLWIGPFWGSVSRTRRGSHGLTWTPCSDLQGIWSPLLGLVGLAMVSRPTVGNFSGTALQPPSG